MSTVTSSPIHDSGHEPSPLPDEKALFSRLAATMARRRRLVMALWLVIVLGSAPLAISLTGALSGAGWDAKGSIAESVRLELRSDFPALGAENPVVVFRQDMPIAENSDALNELVAELANGPRVLSVVDPLSMPPEAGMISMDGMTALIPVEQEIGEEADRPEAAGELGDFVSDIALTDGVTADVTGEWPVWSDFNHMNEKALHKAELLSGLPTLVMLFIAFGALLAAGVPLILAIAGIAVGFASLHMISWISPMSVWSMNFSMMIGLAVGIDYSLFIVSRYREERAEGKDAIQAIENTMSTAGKAVFLSALTVVLSLAAVFLVPVMVFQTMALGMILSVVAVAVAALTLLPAVLVGMGDKVLVSRNKKDPDIAAEGRWARWTGVALKRPGRVLTVGLVLLGALAVPAIGMKLGMPGARVVDEGHTSRDGYETLVAAFGPGAAAPAFITVDASEAEATVDVANRTENVVDARIVTPPSETGRVVVRAIPGTAIDDSKTATMVEDLRTNLSEAAVSARVGGPAAQNQNFGLGGRAGLVVVRIVRGVEVGGVGLEFGGAGVDEAKGREELLFFLPSADGAGAGCQLSFRTGEQPGEIEIRQPGEAGFPEQRETGGIPQPGLLLDPAGDLGDFLKIIEKPRVNFGDLVNAFDRPPPIQRMAEVP